MAFLGDYHTHTNYSRSGKKLHGKGTVLQNAQAAAAMGLKELAVTDHGYGHVFGVKGEAAFAALKAECAEAERQTGVRVYAGLENNLNPKSGKKPEISPLINFSQNELDSVEIVQGGYHAYVGTPRLVSNMAFWTRNVVFGFAPTRKLIERNTLVYKRFIDEYPVDFIGHIGRGILVDVVEVAKYAHERGVYIELNGRHKTLKKDEVKSMVAAGVEFICNSDAHKPENVGQMTYGVQLIQEYNIPYELVANWERLPDFRSNNFNAARERKTQGGGKHVDD